MKTQNPSEQYVRSLVRQHIASRAALIRAGVLRSDRTLQSDYAEWLVSRRLKLRLASSAVEAGHDATDRKGTTYQIKARVVHALSTPTSFDFRSFDHHFDFLIGVFFNHRLEVLGIIKVPRPVVVTQAQSVNSGFRLRWNKRLAEDSRIERIDWSAARQS